MDIVKKCASFAKEERFGLISKCVMGGILATISTACLIFSFITNPWGIVFVPINALTYALFHFVYNCYLSNEFNEKVSSKISYKQFKELSKSGEIAKWQQEFINQIFETYEYVGEQSAHPAQQEISTQEAQVSQTSNETIQEK